MVSCCQLIMARTKHIGIYIICGKFLRIYWSHVSCIVIKGGKVHIFIVIKVLEAAKYSIIGEQIPSTASQRLTAFLHFLPFDGFSFPEKYITKILEYLLQAWKNGNILDFIVGSTIQSWANRIYFDNRIYCPFLGNSNQ